MRQFGTPPPAGTLIRRRPGAYALLVDDDGRLAVVRVPNGNAHLPGGGIEAGESPEEALVREVQEETGWSVELRGEIGSACQYATFRGEHWNKVCRFWLARPLHPGSPTETDHELLWWTMEQAQRNLVHAAYRFIVAETFFSDPH